jgi:hypothetical protein
MWSSAIGRRLRRLRGRSQKRLGERLVSEYASAFCTLWRYVRVALLLHVLGIKGVESIGHFFEQQGCRVKHVNELRPSHINGSRGLY